MVLDFLEHILDERRNTYVQMGMGTSEVHSRREEEIINISWVYI